MQAPRQFKCSLSNCGQYTPFDLKVISKPGSNCVECQVCHKKWFATLIPSCCKIDILFVLEPTPGNKPRTSLQSFRKG